MTEWIIICNPKYYNVIDAFKKLSEIDWKRSINAQVGDIIYIYVGQPFGCLKYKCQITGIDMSIPIDDDEFVSESSDSSFSKNMRLKLLKEYPDGKYSREILMDNGLKTVQGPSKVSRELSIFINRFEKQSSIYINDANSKMYIDYLGVMNYLDQYALKPYAGPGKKVKPSKRAQYDELKEHGQAAVNELKKMVELCHRKFKLERGSAIKWLDGSNTNAREYLWVQLKFPEYNENPESISIFVDKNPETLKARYRISFEIVNNDADKEEMKKYHSYLDLPADSKHGLVYVKGNNENGYVSELKENQETIKEKLQSGIYDKIQYCKLIDRTENLTNNDCERMILEGIEALLPYYKYVVDEEEWSPSLSDYDPCISVEEYEKYFMDPMIHNNWLDVLYYMYDLGGTASCTQIAKKYGNTSSHYNMNAAKIAEQVLKLSGQVGFDDGENRKCWPVLFYGRKATENESGTYIYRLRENVSAAIYNMIERGNFKNMIVEDKDEKDGIFGHNIILYGPPGTGKTYHSVHYAVAICEGRCLSDIQKEDYKEVLKRYKVLKEAGRIAFTTFHQSYGYEEFIEGIKPETDIITKNITYSIESGIFKKFCNIASKATITTNPYGIAEDTMVWKVTILPEVQQDCFDNNRVRIDWSMDSEGTNGFVNDIKKGDIIITTNKSRSVINGIAVTTEEDAYSIDTKNNSTTRTVVWLAKDIREDIIKFNAGKLMHRMTCARVPNMNISALIKLAKEKNPSLTDTVLTENKKPYVFIIDEINRGNISKIFGELITLIEDTKRGGAKEATEAILPYSGELFCVPRNVYILGTMNTADRSIAMIDTALRRRFHFVEMMPDNKVLDGIIVFNNDVHVDICAMLEIINRRIAFLFDREHMIGHAFFTKLKENPTIDILANIFRQNIIPLLQEYFYEDYEKIQLVLGDNEKSDNKYKFITKKEISAASIFNGSSIDYEDTSEYSINDAAFYEINSYKEIFKDL